MGKILPIHPFRRAFEKAGAKRISDSAASALAEAIEGIGIQILMDAKEFAEHAGRKTIQKEDIKKAAEIFLRLI